MAADNSSASFRVAISGGAPVSHWPSPYRWRLHQFTQHWRSAMEAALNRRNQPQLVAVFANQLCQGGQRFARRLRPGTMPVAAVPVARLRRCRRGLPHSIVAIEPSPANARGDPHTGIAVFQRATISSGRRTSSAFSVRGVNDDRRIGTRLREFASQSAHFDRLPTSNRRAVVGAGMARRFRCHGDR